MSAGDPQDVNALLIRRARHAGLADVVQLIQQRHATAPAIGHTGPAAREVLRLTPTVSWTFPTSDLSRIAARPGDGDGWHIEVACFGLYGPSSPLPSYLSESLIDDSRDSNRRVKAFLDIFNHRLLSLLVRALGKHRPFSATAGTVVQRATGDADSASAGDTHSAHVPLIAGLLGRRPMSAAAVEAALRAWLPGIGVVVEPCVPSWTDLPPSAQARLGTPLGGGLGTRMRTCVTAFRVSCGPLDGAQFENLLPGGVAHARVLAVAREANPSALDLLIRLTTAPGALPPSRLDGSARLGRTSRLDGPDHGHVIDLAPLTAHSR